MAMEASSSVTPWARAPTSGPCTAQGRDDVDGQVDDAGADGGPCRVEADPVAVPGTPRPSTVPAGIKPSMRVASEEVSAPVARSTG